MLFGYPFALKLQDLDGRASHSLLLVTAIAMFAMMVSAMLRKNTRRHGACRGVRRRRTVWYLLGQDATRLVGGDPAVRHRARSC